MTGPLKVLARNYTPPDLRKELDKTGFDGTVAVQARQMVEESEFLLELTRTYPWILGVVGWVDFESSDLEAQLDRFTDNAKFKGVRELIHDMPDPAYASCAVHSRAVSMLAERNLTYDLLLKPPNIPAAIELVDRYPKQPFVIDHIAKPDISGGMIEPWSSLIGDIAKRQHVYCKLSGMVTEADWKTWKPVDLEPYLDAVLEAFGPSRLMIGSDWPVCTCAGTYGEVMGTVVSYVEKLSDSERVSILGETCRRFYGL
jgi:L-fuconolactonase